MNFIKYILLITAVVGNIRQASGNSLWDYVLMDISGDMELYGKNGVNELNSAVHCINHLISLDKLDSIMVFANGRTKLSVSDIFDHKYDYSDIRKIIGDGTSINDALASCMGTEHPTGRILVLSNGREVGSSISSKTLAKLMKSRGIKVDAVIVSSDCDSVYVKSASTSNDSIIYLRNNIYPGLNNIVKSTGGKIITIGSDEDPYKAIKGFISSITKATTKRSKKKCDLNVDLTDRLLTRINPQKLLICEVDTNVVISFRENKYHGLAEILSSENADRSILIDRVENQVNGACNIVFVSDPTERDKKQSILHHINSANCYCKLNQSTPIEVLPMIYYSGTGSKMFLCGLEYEATSD